MMTSLRSRDGRRHYYCRSRGEKKACGLTFAECKTTQILQRARFASNLRCGVTVAQGSFFGNVLLRWVRTLNCSRFSQGLFLKWFLSSPARFCYECTIGCGRFFLPPLFFPSRENGNASLRLIILRSRGMHAVTRMRMYTQLRATRAAARRRRALTRAGAGIGNILKCNKGIKFHRRFFFSLLLVPFLRFHHRMRGGHF